MANAFIVNAYRINKKLQSPAKQFGVVTENIDQIINADDPQVQAVYGKITFKAGTLIHEIHTAENVSELVGKINA